MYTPNDPSLWYRFGAHALQIWGVWVVEIVFIFGSFSGATRSLRHMEHCSIKRAGQLEGLDLSFELHSQTQLALVALCSSQRVLELLVVKACIV